MLNNRPFSWILKLNSMNELLDSNENKPQSTSYFKRIVLTNLAILALYTTLCFIKPQETGGALSDALFIVLHVGICTILGIIFAIASKSDWAKGFLLSAFLVALIGFGSCMGLASIVPAHYDFK